MAKPKSPKKNGNDVKEAVSTANSGSNGGSVEAPTAAATEATKKTAARRTARKPEVVKSEPRANLVPINLEDEVRRLAYLLSERRGFESGHETEDWLAAEREIRQRYHQHSA
ncbi:MAG TPA: DUF2934 domain-containing protein [Candidatus Sulfotelmatobacter sp.]|nr:DUF2934 domain-containing protein [Candidatus Sulfotelmatobacter sp.]